MGLPAFQNILDNTVQVLLRGHSPETIINRIWIAHHLLINNANTGHNVIELKLFKSDGGFSIPVVEVKIIAYTLRNIST